MFVKVLYKYGSVFSSSGQLKRMFVKVLKGAYNLTFDRVRNKEDAVAEDLGTFQSDICCLAILLRKFSFLD